MTYVIAKTFRFSAAHHLPQLAEGHPCRNVHGHNFTVTAVLTCAEPDSNGFVLDYGDLDGFRTWINDNLDHGKLDLNEYFTEQGWGLPTAENLAERLFDVAIEILYELNPHTVDLLHTMVVQETPGTMAAYCPTGTPLVWTA